MKTLEVEPNFSIEELEFLRKIVEKNQTFSVCSKDPLVKIAKYGIKCKDGMHYHIGCFYRNCWGYLEWRMIKNSGFKAGFLEGLKLKQRYTLEELGL